jgi:molybdopterin molybdotransferase
MITFENAYEIVSNSAKILGVEEVNLMDTIGRVIAQDIVSDINMPPFDKSAVDGYACKRSDFNNKNNLEILEIIKAGKNPEMEVVKGHCSKIMTGAMLPFGAEIVVMVEDTEVVENKVHFLNDKTSANICYLAEDIKTNDIVLTKGSYIKPQHIAVLASVGANRILVFRQPKVGIISTGDELVEPEIVPKDSQIRNSNAWQLMAQVRNAGGIPEYIGIAKDDKDSTSEMITNAFKINDIVILTGGVSMGDFDYVPEIMNEIGVEILFKSIAVQPGRPTVFGIKDDKYIFGLPGNPVSSFVQFEILVKHLIHKLQSSDINSVDIILPMGADINRKKTERKSFIPVNIKEGKLYPIDYHGSAHIHSYVFADGIIAMEKGVLLLRKGELVNVRQL